MLSTWRIWIHLAAAIACTGCGAGAPGSAAVDGGSGAGCEATAGGRGQLNTSCAPGDGDRGDPAAASGAVFAAGDLSPIVVTNQYQNTCEVYSFEFTPTTNGDSFTAEPIWSLSLPHSATDCKYKRNASQQHFAGQGDLVVAAGGDQATVWNQSTKALLWQTTGLKSLAPHGVELLPDGNLAVSGPGAYGCDTSVAPAGCPDGATIFSCGGMRIFNVADSSQHYDFPLCGAHGLAYDWHRKVLWVTSRGRLTGYHYDSLSWPATKPNVYRDATVPSGLVGFNSYLHDGRVLPNGRVLMVSTGNALEYDPDTDTWLPNSTANCNFNTSFWKCSPSGIPDYGSQGHGNQLNSADVDPVTWTAIISKKDGVGRAWDSNTISFFPTAGPYYNMTNSSATDWYYRVHFWLPEYP